MDSDRSTSRTRAPTRPKMGEKLERNITIESLNKEKEMDQKNYRKKKQKRKDLGFDIFLKNSFNYVDCVSFFIK